MIVRLKKDCLKETSVWLTSWWSWVVNLVDAMHNTHKQAKGFLYFFKGNVSRKEENFVLENFYVFLPATPSVHLIHACSLSRSRLK